MVKKGKITKNCVVLKSQILAKYEIDDFETRLNAIYWGFRG